MDLALNNLERLICKKKKKTTNQPKLLLDYTTYIRDSFDRIKTFLFVLF